MEVYVYSDESGVFDKAHNKYFVYGGLIFLSREARDAANRKYLNAERKLTLPADFEPGTELKACFLSNKNKGKMFRSMNDLYKFGGIVHQETVLNSIFKSKKDKQRYLDYVYKISVKRAFQKMIREGLIVPSEVKRLHFFVDEHSTATNGRYELKEALEQEFRRGTYNMNYDIHFPPIFTSLDDVRLEFCNSAKTPLIRASDITANKLYHLALQDDKMNQHEKFYSLEIFKHTGPAQP